MAYISNYCPNPSFEVSTLGWSKLLGTTLDQVSSLSSAGQYSGQVQTPGAAPGEGIMGPQGLFTDAATGSVSVSLTGETGELLVSAVANPGGLVLGSQVVELSVGWPRVELDGLDIPTGAEVYILIQTTKAQALTFWVDAVQYEPKSPASPYIDGDTPNCDWLGTPGLSASEQPLQNPVTLVDGAYTSGSINVIVPGTASQIPPTTAVATSGGSIVTTVVSPQGAFDDFGFWEAGDPDPAQTYVSWNNAGGLSGQTSYNRSLMAVVPPLDYPVSDGSLLWPRAAFMALGFQFASVPAGAAENLTSVMAEICPLVGTSDQVPVPSTWDNPRAIHTIIRPTRLNFSPNPSFEFDISGWSAGGGATITRDSSQSYQIDGFYDGQPIYTSRWSMRLDTPSGGFAHLLVPELIYGDTYIASAYVLGGAAVITPVGGEIIDQGVDTSNPDWQRPWTVFTAPASTVTLQVIPQQNGTIWVDANLIESGEVLSPYFDGDFSNPDYMWESGGTPGAARAYYYEGFRSCQAVVQEILARNIPLGISAAPPVYLEPYTQ